MPKKHFPLAKVYGLLEPGPVLLLTTAKGALSNAMVLSWHTMLEFEPPLIDECFASLECRVVDTGMVRKYSFFVLEVIAAWVDAQVRNPRTLHHRGYGRFMVAGETVKLPSRMR